MRINFIRHGKTQGNLEKRYIGSTDEPLCTEGISELKEITYPDCGVLVSSPMIRCIMTAKLIYPGVKYIVRDGLRECDFGDFEGKNYCELSDDPRYQNWIDSGGRDTFPNGENPSDFRDRCADEFLRLTAELNTSDILSLVVHGGTIMAIMEKFAVPHKDFYDWYTINGHGYITGFDGKKITVLEKI